MKTQRFQIGARRIARCERPYVIAEIGVNHDGDADLAHALIDAAADAGADAVKFQYFRADLLMSAAGALAVYQRDAGEHDARDMLRRLELSLCTLRRAAAYAHRRGLHAIVTVFSTELVAEAAGIPWDAFKTASPDIIHKPLLEAIAATGKPMIVSTGASTLDEVVRAAQWLTCARDRLAFLQCVSAYPTPTDSAAYAGIPAIAQATGLPVGYSDHTPGDEAAEHAVRCGALLLEKHLTHNTAADGPDHAASLSPESLRRYVERARAAVDLPPLTPEPVKGVLDIEQDVRRVSRQSIVARRDMPAAHVLTAADLTVKRPGGGLPPYRLAEIVGATLARPLSTDQTLTPHDIMGFDARPQTLKANAEAAA